MDAAREICEREFILLLALAVITADEGVKHIVIFIFRDSFLGM